MTKEEESIKYFQGKIEWAKQKCYPYISKGEVEIFETAIEALKQEPKTDWIPVSERLPEIGDYVLCSVANYYSKYKIVISQYNHENYWHNGIIEAWMPLPEPYKVERSDEE